MHLEQKSTPLAEALNAQRINRLAHFDVPAHKGGRMNPELAEYFGKATSYVRTTISVRTVMRFLALKLFQKEVIKK